MHDDKEPDRKTSEAEDRRARFTMVSPPSPGVHHVLQRAFPPYPTMPDDMVDMLSRLR